MFGYGYGGVAGGDGRVSALLDMINGGGAGRAGQKFEGGGLLSMLGNVLTQPYGAEARGMTAPDASMRPVMRPQGRMRAPMPQPMPQQTMPQPMPMAPPMPVMQPPPAVATSYLDPQFDLERIRALLSLSGSPRVPPPYMGYGPR